MHPTTNTLFYYLCIACARKFSPDRLYHTCPDCGGLLLVERDIRELRKRFAGITQFKRHFEEARKRGLTKYPLGSGVWQWSAVLLPDYPLDDVHSFREGRTDLWSVPVWKRNEWKARGQPMDKVFVSCLGQTPSGSFKDFGMTTLVSEALRQVALHPDDAPPILVCASTGDTSASLARYVSYVSDILTCVVLVPHGKISPAQLYQVLDAGALVLEVESDDGFDACLRLVRQLQEALPNIVLANSINAMRIVGQEAISLNIFQDLGWKVPDWLVIPCGNAGNLTAQMSAWLLLKELRVIARLPKIIVAQTKRANTLMRWINDCFTNYKPGEPGPTAASAMNIQDPASFPRVEYLRKKGGFELLGYDVSEAALAATRAEMNRAGAGLCPQGAVAFDAMLQARQENRIAASDTVVVLATALDIKFPEAGATYHLTPDAACANPPRVVPDDLSSVVGAITKTIRSKS